MNELGRKLLFFGLQFIPLFVVFVFIYLAVFPFYAPIAVETANAVTQRLSPPTHLKISGNGDWQAFIFNPRVGIKPMRGWGSATSHLILLSLALLPALLLASPGPILTRFKLLGIALPLMFLAHVFSIVGLTRGVQCLSESPGTFLCLWMLRLVYSSGQFLAAVLWVLLTWRQWLSRPA